MNCSNERLHRIFYNRVRNILSSKRDELFALFKGYLAKSEPAHVDAWKWFEDSSEFESYLIRLLDTMKRRRI